MPPLCSKIWRCPISRAVTNSCWPPLWLRDKVMELIDGEIAKGQEGYLFMKLNSITDRKIIDKLVQASQQE